MKRINQPSRHSHPSHKTIIIAAIGVVVVAAIGAYWYVSAAAWQNYDATTQAHVRGLREQTRTLQSDTTSLDEKRQAITSLSNNAVAERSCEVAWWYGWQARFGGEEMIGRCQQAASQNRTIKNRATDVVALLKNEMTLQEIVTDVTPGTKKLTETSWEAAHKKVHTATTKLRAEDSSIHEDYVRVFEEASKRLTALDKAWHAFMNAHEKKDEAAFMSAIDRLDQRYKGLSAIAEDSDVVLGKHLNALSKQL